ncbi:MAG TPA: GumC family protein, partial [Pararhizobium sp.]|nr:GumC family protein [Pararhizobium sp.]
MQRSKDEERRMPPSGIAGTLWQRRRLIALTTALFVLLAGLYIGLTDPVYTARASILIDPPNRQTKDGPGATVTDGVGALTSNSLLTQVFKEQGLENDPEYSGHGWLPVIGSAKPVAQDAAFRNFQSRVSIGPNGHGPIIDIDVTSSDPQKAALIANAIVNRYEARLAARKNAAGEKKAKSAADEIAELRKRAAGARQALEAFNIHHPVDGDIRAGLRSDIEKLASEHAEAKRRADRAEKRYKQALALGTTPKGMIALAGMVSSETVDRLRREYARQSAALAKAAIVYGPKYPTIINLKASLSETERRMSEEARRITRRLKAEDGHAADNLAGLQARLVAMRQRLREANEDAEKQHQLQVRADAGQAALDEAVRRSAAAVPPAAPAIPSVRVISSATPPATADWPKPIVLLPAGAALGLLAGCGLALAAGPRRRSGKHETEISPAREIPRLSPPQAVPLEVMAARPEPAEPLPANPEPLEA